METDSCGICGMTRERAKQCGIRVLLHSPKTDHQNKLWENVVRRQDNLATSLLVCSRHFYQGFPSHFPKCQDYVPRDELVCKETPLNYYQMQLEKGNNNGEDGVQDSTKTDSQTMIDSEASFGCKLCPTFYPTKRKLDEHRIETHTTECELCKRPFFATDSKICSVCECKMRKPMVHHRPVAPKPAPVITARIHSINPDVFIPSNIHQTRTVYSRINHSHTRILSNLACIGCERAFTTLEAHNQHRNICRKCQASFCAPRHSKGTDICPNCYNNPLYACGECKRRFYSESDWDKHKVQCKECYELFCTNKRFKQTDICTDCKYKLYFDPNVMPPGPPNRKVPKLSPGPSNHTAPKVIPESNQLIIPENMNFKCGSCHAKFDTASAFELHLKFCIDEGSSQRKTVPVSNLVPLMQQVASKTDKKGSSKKTGPLADHPTLKSGTQCKFCKDKVSRCGNCDRTITRCYICDSYLPQSALARHFIRVHLDRDISTEPISTETIAIGEMKEDEKNVLSEFDIFKNSEKVVYFGGIEMLDEKPIKIEADIKPVETVSDLGTEPNNDDDTQSVAECLVGFQMIT